MKYFNWNAEKSRLLKKSRGISFEDAVFHIARGEVLADYGHPNPSKYHSQRIMVVKINDYACLIPYVESEDEIFLKTIIPSRKATQKYLGEKDEA
jgi:hypothetical protein